MFAFVHIKQQLHDIIKPFRSDFHLVLSRQSVYCVFNCCVGDLIRWRRLSPFLTFTLMLSRPSASDASLELCVMPKDEDILQLVSI